MRFFSKRQRRILAWAAGFQCQVCGKFLGDRFHADHKIPYSKGGKTIVTNGQALCAKCNLKKGSKLMSTPLRPWQQEAIAKSIHWLTEIGEDRHFLINAAPGAGKTICACSIALTLMDQGFIDRVIVIAPRSEVVNQWSRDCHAITNRYMGKVTASDEEFEEMGIDVCVTWQAVQGLADVFHSPAPLGRRAHLCMARTVPQTGQGLGANHCQCRNLAARRSYTARQ